MAKKRKSQAMNLDEADRTIYSTFCSAANSLSHLYSQAINHQKLSFQAGQRHGLDKLYQWILQKQEGGSRVTIVDILTRLQTDLDCYGEEPSLSPREPPPNQHSQETTHFPNSTLLGSSGPSGSPIAGHDFRSERSKTCIFSDSLSSPVRLSLQNYHIAPGGYHSNGVQPSSDPFNSNDSTMDMHADSPGHQSTHW